MDFLRRAVLLALTLALPCSGISVALSQEAARDKSLAVLQTDSVMQDLCDKTVVMLGESPVHGFGKVLDFKVELVRRLIRECHFNGFYIESGAYDFLKIQKMLNSRKPVSGPMIEAAIGGIWANQETERLIPDLLQGVQSGKLRLGGFDDQLSRGTYAQRDMPGDLVQYLDGNAKQECLSILQRHTLWQYSSDSPYGPKDNARIAGCLDQIEAAASRKHTENAACDLAMVASFKRSLARDFPAPLAKDMDVQLANERDRSMYQNFQWLRSRMPSRSKIIVWTATTHAAKDLSGVPGSERISMGSFIHRDLGERAFTLGFSEYSGSYAFSRQPARLLTTAPNDSLESRAFAGNGMAIRYFGLNDLRNFGPIAARPLGVEFKTAKWDDVLDGLVVFREEHPPTVSAKSRAE
jgi:erythromycin esterase-like protein